jgi:hypothetical protein
VLALMSDSSKCGASCGILRWPVKTATDLDVGEINETPKPATVAELRRLAKPLILDKNRRAGSIERTVYRVRAKLLGWMKEEDGDLHLVIASRASSSRTMIIEIPSSECELACSSKYMQRFRAAYGAVMTRLGAPSARYRSLSQAPWVNVVGIGFFDFNHGQTGRAPNDIELHPVLDIQFE